MRFLTHFNYFFYLAFNWNVRIAFHLLKQEVKGEKKYGINTTGADELKHLEDVGIDIQNATIYMPASYELLEEIYRHIDLGSYNHFLDIGSGKGRALCVAAHFGIRKMTGVDISGKLCSEAETNLSIINKHFPGLRYDIITKDAYFYEVPTGVDCIFMFNPFDDVILNAVAENILESYELNPRPICIIYINPMFKQELINIGFRQVYHVQKMKYLEAVVLKKE